MKYIIKTLGCKANLYDSQAIEAQLQSEGWSASRGEEAPEVCFINSCTVTDEADKQSRAVARKFAKKYPGIKVVMTGCGAEVDPEGMKQVAGVSYVVSNRDKNRMLELLKDISRDVPLSDGAVLGQAEGYSELLSRHPMDREWPTPESSFILPVASDGDQTHRTRAFLKIQEGCDAFCTYCIIPYGRGPSRSLGIPALLDQVRSLVDSGVREIVLTGTNIGDYQPSLDVLIQGIILETKLERLRVSSLDPTEITLYLYDLMQSEPRFCAHFHVSLQSPVSKVLKLMKRKYSAVEVANCLNKISELKVAQPGGVFVGMDVISGFPGESDDDFNETFESLKALPWSRLHVFPYSERKGTPATRLPHSVPGSERVRRAKVLRDLSFERLRAHYQFAWSSIRAGMPKLDSILVEGETVGPSGDKNWVTGYSNNYLRFIMRPSEKIQKNQIVSAEIDGITEDPISGDLSFIGK